MQDFLTFKYFVTPDILIIAYYMGAILIPILMWLSRHYLIGKFSFISQINDTRKAFFSTLSQRNKTLLILFFIFMFLMMELMWRMMFEAMIGYFHMHNYLQTLSAGQQ